LYIVGSGAVTAAGLTVAQTCAAFRAGLTGFAMELLDEPFGAEQTVARIPTSWRLRRDPGQWILNLATRAVREAFLDAEATDMATPERTALFLTPPEGRRNHPCYDHLPPREVMARVLSQLQLPFHAASRAFDGGAAAGLGTLTQACELITKGIVDHVILAGADSLVNTVDLRHLAAANRLAGDTNAQGLVPGEGAAAVCLSGHAPRNGKGPTCVVLSVGSAQERDSVLTENFSQGRAMLAALREASRKGEADAEPLIDFVLSNANGERYAAWEWTITRSRFYRTRRDRTPVAYPAMSVGETGAASAALALVIARDAFARGYAPGRMAMAEVASDEGMRSAAILRTTAPAA
jgi:3-oxoacyl-[acyl-carrier-protein] synthase I